MIKNMRYIIYVSIFIKLLIRFCLIRVKNTSMEYCSSTSYKIALYCDLNHMYVDLLSEVLQNKFYPFLTWLVVNITVNKINV